jgi:S-adenosylmethionine uptake transporter
MVGASLLFALMGVCVKLASAHYGAGEVVFYRSLIGAIVIAAAVRWHGGSLRTPVPSMHFWRSASGVLALVLWFHAIAGLPLATAMTLNYMSSVWMALFLVGGAILYGAAAVDGRLVAAVLAGFAGVALVLQPSIEQRQLWHGLAGLLSGVLAALAYLSVTALGRAGEPDTRVVFYFSVFGVVLGAATMVVFGAAPHTPRGAALLLAIGLLAVAAQMMLTRAYTTGTTLAVAALQYLGIVFGTLFGALIFGEAIGALALLGTALIIGAGLTATMLRARTPAADSKLPTEA